MHLIFPTYLNGKSMEKVLEYINENGSNYDIVDMSNIKFIFPYGLNMLLHILEEINSFNTIKLPNNKIMSYLIRMDFFNLLFETWDLPEDILYKISLHKQEKSEDNKTLLELTKIKDFTDVFPIMQRIEEKIKIILETQLGYNATEIEMFKNIFAELCQNISRHSKSHGYVSVQYVPYYFTRNTKKYNWPVKIGITDTGIGFAASYGTSTSDKDALKEAIVENKSSKAKGGMGLKYIKNYVKDFDGELYIRSGSACYYQDGKNGEYSIEEDIPLFIGSQIDITLPSKKS